MATKRSDGVVPTRSNKYEKRRVEIAEIAARLFAKRGYDATSMNDLTAAIGLQRGALYHYIDSKKDLLYLIHDGYIQPLLKRFRAIEEANDPPEASLRAMGQALMKTIHDQQDQVTVFLNEWRAIRNDEAWEDVRAAELEVEKILERVFQRGVDEGVFKVKTVRIATLGFFGMINWGYTWIDPDGPWSSTRLADELCEIYIGGILARDANGRVEGVPIGDPPR